MRDDAAQLQAIEAILVACALVGSATFIVMYSVPAAPPAPARGTIGSAAGDSMDVLAEEPAALVGYGDSHLSRALALCLMRDCDELDAAIAASLPADARFNAWISNGYGDYPLIRDYEPSGEKLAITRLVEPKWSYTFLGFDYNYSDPALGQPLNVYALPVLKSNALTEGGTPVGVSVTGYRKDTGEQVRFSAFGSTLQKADSREANTTAVSLYFVDDDDAPTAFLDRSGVADFVGDRTEPVLEDTTETVTNTTEDLSPSSTREALESTELLDTDGTLDGTTDPVTDTTDGTTDTATNATADATSTVDASTGSPTAGHRVRVRVLNSGNESVGSGTPLRVELPRDWSADAPIGNNGEWIIAANATDHNGTHGVSHVLAFLRDDLSAGASATLTLEAHYHGASEDYRVITAEFGKNGRARAEAILRGAEHAVPPATDQPHLAVSIPKPVGVDMATTWTIGFVAPLVTQDADEVSDANPDGLLDVGVTLTRIDVWGWNTHGLFASVTNVTGPAAGHGAWSVTDGNLTWRGNVDVGRDAPLNVRFDAMAAPLLNAPIARYVGPMPVEFDSWRGKLVQQFEYGFMRGSVYPEDSTPGAGQPGHATAKGTHQAIGLPAWQSHTLKGAAAYHADTLPTYRDAAAGGWIAPDDREVRVGERVTLEADVGSLLRKLQDTGSSSVNVTLRVYGPYTVEKKVPIWEKSLSTTGDGEDVTDLVTWDTNADGYADVIVSTSLGRVYAIDGLTGAVDEERLWSTTAETVDAPRVVRLVRGTWDGTPVVYASTGATTGTRVHVLDASLTEVASWAPPVSGAGRVLAAHPGTDLDGDGVANVLVTFSNGETYRLANAPDAAAVLRAKALHAGGAAGAAKLAALGHLGVGGPAGFAVATDASEDAGAVGVTTLAGTALELADGGEIVVQAVLSPHNVAAADAGGETRWELPLLPVTAMDALDANGDGGADVAAGLRTGHVLALDGAHANALMTPLRFKGNLRVIDSDASNPNDVWFLTADGGVGRTRDGWNTLECVCDPVTGQFVTVPGGVSITRDSTGRVYVANGALVTVLEESATGAKTTVKSFNGNVTFTNGVMRYTPGDAQIHRVKQVESAAGALLALVEHACNDAGAECETSLLMSMDRAQTWTEIWTQTEKALGQKGYAAYLGDLDCRRDGTSVCYLSTGGLLEKLNVALAGSGVVFDLTRVEAGVNITTTFCEVTGKGERCMIASDSGSLRVVEDPFGPDRNVSSETKTDAPLVDVERAGDGVVYGAGENVVYASWDDGVTFRKLHLPVGAHLPSGIHAFGNGQAYVMGGSGGEMQVLVARSFHRVSEVQGVLPLEDRTGYHVENVTLVATERYLSNSTSVDGAWIQYFVKDAAGNWVPFARKTVEGATRTDLDAHPDAAELKEETMTLQAFTEAYPALEPLRFPVPQDLDAIEWRAVLHASPDVPAAGPRVFNLTFRADLVDPVTQGARKDAYASENFTDASRLIASATTAEWNTSTGVVSAPLASLHWSQDVRGEVLDLRVVDATADGVADVIVGTGAAFAVTDTSSWTSDVDSLHEEVGTENRVYVLDGALKGRVLWKSHALPGKVTRVDLTRDDAGNTVVVATAVSEENATTRVHAFNATTGEESWSHALNKPASALTHVLHAQNASSARVPFPVVGTRGASATDDGTVFALDSLKGDRAWRTAYGEVGHYRVPLRLSEATLFGPHVVEIEVSWVEELADTTPFTQASDAGGTTNDTALHDPVTTLANATAPVTNTTRTVREEASALVQAARYYNYFTAVPPDGRMPVSPVYALKIEAWIGDWDYGTWTPTALDPGAPAAGPVTEGESGVSTVSGGSACDLNVKGRCRGNTLYFVQ